MKTLKIRITFQEELLGTSNSDAHLHEKYVASKSPDAKNIAEEVEALGVDNVVSKGMTIFPKENGKPFVWDYQIQGFFKDSCGALARVKSTRSSSIKAFKKIIGGLIFPQPRKIMLNLPEGSVIGTCQRPLRAATAQGERIALANSETVPSGTTMDVDLKLLDDSDKHQKLIVEWLDYGALRGMGGWRSSGKGRFTYEILKG